MDDDDECRSSPNGKHEPDWSTLTNALGVGAAPGIVDVACKHCGHSGSTRVLPEDINW
jgi:hypothetical protein